MPKFLCVQRKLPSSTPSSEQPSPAQMQEMFSNLGEWMEKFKDNLVDPGGGVGQGRLVAAEEPKDGPFVEVKELIGGYMIVSADDIERAIEVARACPGLVRPGSGVEVLEIVAP